MPETSDEECDIKIMRELLTGLLLAAVGVDRSSEEGGEGILLEWGRLMALIDPLTGVWEFLSPKILSSLLFVAPTWGDRLN